jgi:Yip1-like protein
VPESTASRWAATTASKGLVARLIGVLTSPGATYAEVAARPRWPGALSVVLLVTGVGVSTFMSTEVGRLALLDQQITMMESFGRRPNDAQTLQMENRLAHGQAIGVAGQAVAVVLAALLMVAVVALAIFNALLDGKATFKQVFSVVAHSGFVIAVQQILVLPLDYARESLSSPTNLAVFFSFLDENTLGARLLGSIDLFIIWWMMSLAIGLSVLYQRRTASTAAAILAIYLVIAFVLAAVKTTLSGA